MANPNFAPTFSTNEVWRNLDVNRCLTDDLDALESSVSTLETNKADSDHTHTGYAAESHSHTEYALTAHEHEGYASSDHSHTEYAASSHEHTGYASSSHEHTGYALMEHTHTGYADSSHTHTQSEITGLTDALNDKADSSHSHSGYASSNHTHSEYAEVDHSHDEYFSSNGGTIGGTTNVNGVFRVQGQQMLFFDEGNTNALTIGTNNATGGVTICNGSSATMNLGGALIKTPTLVPKSTGTYYCGNANFRWKGVYSTEAVNVSSDKRLKRDIRTLNEEELINFVNNLHVVSYNYKDDPENVDPRIGMIAQDVQKANSEVAKFFVAEDENGYLGLKSADLVFPLIVAVQKLTARVAELEAAK